MTLVSLNNTHTEHMPANHLLHSWFQLYSPVPSNPDQHLNYLHWANEDLELIQIYRQNFLEPNLKRNKKLRIWLLWLKQGTKTKSLGKGS